MNLPESLAREIRRVATLKCKYEAMADNNPRVMVGYATMMMDTALDKACAALGNGDTAEMIGANETLKEFEK